MNEIRRYAYLVAFALASACTVAWAQPAPIPRAVVSSAAAPEAMTAAYRPLARGDNAIDVPGAAWLQLEFDSFQLGDGTLTIRSEQGQSQTFTQRQLEDWRGLTAVFNGDQLVVTLDPGGGEAVRATIGEIVIGLRPGRGQEAADFAVPQNLRDLLGDDIDRFLPDDLRDDAIESAGELEAICGATDDRSASEHALIGRIMPVGCTGWIIAGGFFLTAGHCTGANLETVEFNVPSSQADGTTVAPEVRDQYRVVEDSVVFEDNGIGDDWAVFEVLPNTETGLMPLDAQGGAFQLSDSADPDDLEIIGFGVDGPAPNFGMFPGPRNADNQTQQRHDGALTEHTVDAPDSARLRYTVDTMGGNSGSPVIVEGSDDVAIGIHTHGGCGVDGGSNAGTSFRNEPLWTEIGERTGPRVVQVSGEIVLLRVHDVRTGYGGPGNELDGDVVIRLQGHPDTAFGFPLRSGEEGGHYLDQLALLQTAFANGWRVTIDYLEEPGKTNHVLIRTALEREP